MCSCENNRAVRELLCFLTSYLHKTTIFSPYMIRIICSRTLLLKKIKVYFLFFFIFSSQFKAGIDCKADFYSCVRSNFPIPYHYHHESRILINFGRSCFQCGSLGSSLCSWFQKTSEYLILS